MEPTTEMTFKSEDERLQAIEALGDDPSKEAELDQIMNAKISSDPEGESEAPPETPIDDPGESESEGSEGQESEVPPASDSGVPELPEKFKNWGEFLKSYNESQELIERQGRKIEELVSRSEVIAREPQAPRQEPAQPQNPQPPAREQSKQQSRLSEIKSLRSELREAAKDPEARWDEEYLSKRDRLDDLLVEEMEYSQHMANQAHDVARKTGESYDQYMARLDNERKSEQRKAAWENEVKQIDSFLQKPDVKQVYPMSKGFAEVDRDYVDWSNRVATQYYGRQPQNSNEVAHAMQQLQAGSPTLIDKCKTANIPIEPNQDIKSYLGICDLQDFQDGIRVDPTTGKRVQAMRYDPQLGREVPDRFPTMEAAYNHRLVSSGHFQKQVAKAKQQGGKEVLDAIGRRDSAVVEMGQGQQASGAQEMSNEQAMRVFDTIDPEMAMQSARMGDSSQLDKINNAMKALGVDPPSA